MALESGTRLGHYEVTDLLGKGGMGEVYRARDTKLGREVAIKVLPSEFSRDEERLARLEREARMLAVLNHPNIAAIHGLEESDDTRFLVLELVEGDTLGDRLKKGAIPVEETLKLALQIAEALEAAHEKGVIHRDLKPANIKITPEGRVKVLDFGLAKAFIGDQADVNLSNSPTLSMAATQAGIILGTAAYMSPEQASGEVADHRADLWAFGVVLFEMLTGRQLFTGRTTAHVMGAVLNVEPDWETLPPNLHPRLRVLLERLLEKEAKDRLHSVADARVEIERVLADPAGVRIQPATTAMPQPAASRAGWMAAVAVVGVIAGIAGWALNSPPAPRPVGRFTHLLPDDQRFSNTGRPVVATSADGSRIVYVANQQLWMRAMDAFEATPIPGTEETPTAPFFSPDGEWIGYWSLEDGQLKKIAVSGGAPITLTPAENPFGRVDWGADDTIVWAQTEGIMRVSANGGTAEVLIEDFSLNRPQRLPGSDSILFGVGSAEAGEIWVQSLGSGDRKMLLTGTAAQYVDTGHLVYELEGTLLAVPFDLDALEVTGSPVALVEGVAVPSQYDLSRDGTLVYVPAGAAQAQDRILARVDFEGRIDPLGAPARAYVDPRVSPDGAKVVVQSIDDGGTTLWVYDLADDRAIQQLTFEGNSRRPIWTPDSRRITFSSDRDGTMSVYWILADGSGVAERLTTAADGEQHWPASWSPDGETLAFLVERNRDTDWDVWSLSPGGEPASLYDRPDTVYLGAQFSPDGRRIAYASGPTSGQVDVYVEPFPPDGSRRRITQGGGRGIWPVWAPDGEALYYRPTTGSGLPIQLQAVEIVTEPEFGFRNERSLPIDGFSTVSYYRAFDILPDGSGFVVTFPADTTAEEETRPSIRIVLNWTQELLERVPVD